MNPQNNFWFSDRNDNRAYPITKPWDKKDKQMEIRELVSGNNNLRNRFGQPVLDSQAIRDMQAKIEEYRNMDFTGWANNQMDLSTPLKTKFWMSRLPELFDEKLSTIDEETEIQKKVSLITAFGPQNLSDMRLIYDVLQKQKTLSNMPIYSINQSNQINKRHSMMDNRPLFPQERQTLVNFSNIFDTTSTQPVFEPKYTDNAIVSIFGKNPNNSALLMGQALVSGFKYFS